MGRGSMRTTMIWRNIAGEACLARRVCRTRIVIIP